MVVCEWYLARSLSLFSQLHNRNYVNQATALAQNLTYANGNTLILRADYKTKLSSGGAGRNSVRIQSVKQYTTHVLV